MNAYQSERSIVRVWQQNLYLDILNEVMLRMDLFDENTIIEIREESAREMTKFSQLMI